MDLKQTWQKGLDWIHLVQGRHQQNILVNMALYFSTQSKVGNFLTEELLLLMKDSALYSKLSN